MIETNAKFEYVEARLDDMLAWWAGDYKPKDEGASISERRPILDPFKGSVLTKLVVRHEDGASETVHIESPLDNVASAYADKVSPTPDGLEALRTRWFVDPSKGVVVFEFLRAPKT